MKDYLTPDEKNWVERNLLQFIQRANFIGKRVTWQGRYKEGVSVMANAVVMYEDRVFIALHDAVTSIPKKQSADWGILCALKKMRFYDEVWEMDWSLDEDDIDTLAKSEVINEIVHRVVAGAIDGSLRWRGLFIWGEAYTSGDLVVFDHSVYRALTGDGVPGVWTKLGDWEILDWATIPLLDIPHGVVHDEGVNTNYRVVHDGIPVIHRT